MTNRQWWGWGTSEQTYSLEERSRLWPILQTWLELPDEAVERENTPVPLEEVVLRPSRLDDPVLLSLRRLLGDEAVRTDKRTRVEHAYGKSYRDLIRLRAGLVPRPPDVVVCPADPGQIASVLAWAADRDVLVIPFGGGSSVLGGIEPAVDERPIITLDVRGLNRVLMVDAISRIARIQAGVAGPAIERYLNPRGFTLGHFPESFECSTLGGWIAARSVGQNVIGYGRIENIVQSIRMVTPIGLIEASNAPASGVGPNLMDVLVGSEGAYGVITEAAVCISPEPEVRDYRGVLFQGLEKGIAAFRDLVQSREIRPALIQLSDTFEIALYNGYNGAKDEQQWLRKVIDQITGRYLQLQGFNFAPSSDNILMLMGFEGRTEWANQQWDLAMKVCGDHKGVLVGRGIGQSWLHDRYKWPYLRDMLIERGVMVCRLETTVPWMKLMNVYETAMSAIKVAISATDGGPGYVMMRIAYANEHSVLLRLIFMGRQASGGPDVKLAQSQAIKQAATEAILNAGGTLPCYQPIGHDHARWIEEEIGPLGIKVVRHLKQTFDPENLLNDGVLSRL